MSRPSETPYRSALRAIVGFDTRPEAARAVAEVLGGGARLWKSLERFDLAPTAYVYCRRAGLLGALADERRRGLAARFSANALRQTLMHRRTLEVTALLSAAGIPVLWFKGSWLAPAVYRPPGARVMEDVDLLVPRDRLGEARDRLAAERFEPHPHDRLPGLAPHAAQLRRRDPDLGRDGWLNVDLHGEVLLFEGAAVWTDATWAEAVSHRLDGVDILRPPSALSVAVGALHALYHYLSPGHLLRAVADASWLARSTADPVDWEWLEARSRDPLLAAALALVLEPLTPAIVPAERLAAICLARLEGLGLDPWLRRIRTAARGMRPVRPFDPCLVNVGRKGSALRGLAAMAGRLFSRRRLREHQVVRGEPPSRNLPAGLAAWLRSLAGANWRYARTSYLVGRLEAEVRRAARRPPPEADPA